MRLKSRIGKFRKLKRNQYLLNVCLKGNIQELQFYNYPLKIEIFEKISSYVLFPRLNTKEELLHHLEKILLQNNEYLEFQISKNENFSGHTNKQVIVSNPVKEFFERKPENNSKFHIHKYLAQMPIFEPKSCDFNDFQNKNDFCVPQFIKEYNGNLNSINLWISFENTVSSWHFDAYDNIMVVLEGVKIFYVAPPDHPDFKFNSLLDENSNQLNYIGDGKNGIKSICLKRNEAVYLPKGWFHKVESRGDTIVGLNFWFNKLRLGFYENNMMFLSFYLQNQLQKNIEKKLYSIISNYSHQTRLKLKRIFKQPREYINKLSRNPNKLKYFFRNLKALNSFIIHKFFDSLMKEDQQATNSYYVSNFYENIWKNVSQERFLKDIEEINGIVYKNVFDELLK